MHVQMSLGRFLLFVVLFLPAAAWAAHPLITDDAGTQGAEKFQLELNGQYDSDKETVPGVSVKSTSGEAAATLSYGIIESIDLVLTEPYGWGTVKEDDLSVSDEKGFSDLSFEAKWRFYEKEGTSFAVKPGVSFPTGNHDKGLGTGKTGYHLFLIGSKEMGSWALHANIGYIGNENKVDEERHLWHVSLAATYAVAKDLRVVGNVGMERNTDKAADDEPAFLVAGLVYSLGEDVDLDAGVKYGLTASEIDLSLMAGAAFRL